MATTLPAIKAPSPSPSGGRRSAHAARAGTASPSKSLSPVPAVCDSLQWRRSMGVRRGEFGARSKLIDNPSRMPYQQRKDAGRKKRRRTGQGAADGPDAAAAAATGPQEGVDDEPLPSLEASLEEEGDAEGRAVSWEVGGDEGAVGGAAAEPHRAQVKSFLQELDLVAHYERVLCAFGRAQDPPETWLPELRALHEEEELGAFLKLALELASHSARLAEPEPEPEQQPSGVLAEERPPSPLRPLTAEPLPLTPGSPLRPLTPGEPLPLLEESHSPWNEVAEEEDESFARSAPGWQKRYGEDASRRRFFETYAEHIDWMDEESHQSLGMHRQQPLCLGEQQTGWRREEIAAIAANVDDLDIADTRQRCALVGIECGGAMSKEALKSLLRVQLEAERRQPDSAVFEAIDELEQEGLLDHQASTALRRTAAKRPPRGGETLDGRERQARREFMEQQPSAHHFFMEECLQVRHLLPLPVHAISRLACICCALWSKK